MRIRKGFHCLDAFRSSFCAAVSVRACVRACEHEDEMIFLENKNGLCLCDL